MTQVNQNPAPPLAPKAPPLPVTEGIQGGATLATDGPKIAVDTSVTHPATEAPTAKAADAGSPQPGLTLAEHIPTARPRAFYVACLWHIESERGSDQINASNNQTGDKFKGTMHDFNLLLKGLL